MPTFASMAAGYKAMWRSMKITKVAACDQAARKIIAARARYIAVEKIVGVPWFVIGIWHMRESNNNFAGVLHNGEHIIGTGRKTTLVPRGRGPFTTWEGSAVDALKLHGLQNVKEWPIERIGYETERFNGFGYIGKTNSPYVWAGSNHYTRGKYVADGRYSATFVDTQLGCLPVLASLCKLSSEVDQRVNGKPKPTTEVTTTAGGGGAVIAVGVQQGWGFTEWAIAGIAAVIVIGAVIFLINKYRNREPDAVTLPPVVDDPKLQPIDRGGAAETEN